MRRVLALGCAAFLVLGAGTEPPPPAKPPAPRVVQQMAPEQAEPILGRPVIGADGKELGRLVDVLVTAEGTPQAAVIDFGGFLGVGNRRIAVRWDTMHFTPSGPQRAIVLGMTMDEIKAAPAYGTGASKPVQVVTPELAPDPAAADTAPKRDGAGGPGSGPSDTGVAPPLAAAPSDGLATGGPGAARGSATGAAGSPPASDAPREAASAPPTASGAPPVAGTGPEAAPAAGAVPPTASAPATGAAPPTASAPAAGAVPPTASAPAAGAVPPTPSAPATGAAPPTVSPPTAGPTPSPVPGSVPGQGTASASAPPATAPPTGQSEPAAPSAPR